MKLFLYKNHHATRVICFALQCLTPCSILYYFACKCQVNDDHLNFVVLDVALKITKFKGLNVKLTFLLHQHKSSI